jgi:hypothetical protein
VKIRISESAESSETAPRPRPTERRTRLDYTQCEIRDGFRHRTTGGASQHRENAVTTIEATEWEECVLEPRRNPEVERFLRKNLGASPPGMQGFAECPWLLQFFIGFDFRKAMLAHTSFELADLIGLVVSQDNSCRYCFAEQRILPRSSSPGVSRVPIRSRAAAIGRRWSLPASARTRSRS